MSGAFEPGTPASELLAATIDDVQSWQHLSGAGLDERRNAALREFCLRLARPKNSEILLQILLHDFDRVRLARHSGTQH
jgi:hypothetical protein